MLTKKKIIYTIGHSTRTLEDFVKILQTYKIRELLDIRSIPRSRYTPQFNEENLARELPKVGIVYRHLEKLGGLRKTVKDSLNGAWKNESFRGFADYMQTENFTRGMEELVKIAKQKTVAIMCAEAVPWRCHRSMVGDALLVRGFLVKDIFSLSVAREEKLTEFAKVRGKKITYPLENLTKLKKEIKNKDS